MVTMTSESLGRLLVTSPVVCPLPRCAQDVVGSFEAMRRYLREVKKCLERVDPHLGFLNLFGDLGPMGQAVHRAIL